MSTLSDILIKSRETKSWKQEKVAKLIGKSLRTYQYYEEGRVTPKPDTLKSLAKVLGFKLTEIYEDDEEGAIKLRESPKKHIVILEANVAITLSKLLEISIKHQAAINLLMKTFSSVSAKDVEKEYDRIFDEYADQQGPA